MMACVRATTSARRAARSPKEVAPLGHHGASLGQAAQAVHALGPADGDVAAERAEEEAGQAGQQAAPATGVDPEGAVDRGEQRGAAEQLHRRPHALGRTLPDLLHDLVRHEVDDRADGGQRRGEGGRQRRAADAALVVGRREAAGQVVVAQAEQREVGLVALAGRRELGHVGGRGRSLLRRRAERPGHVILRRRVVRGDRGHPPVGQLVLAGLVHRGHGRQLLAEAIGERADRRDRVVLVRLLPLLHPLRRPDAHEGMGAEAGLVGVDEPGGLGHDAGDTRRRRRRPARCAPRPCGGAEASPRRG